MNNVVIDDLDGKIIPNSSATGGGVLYPMDNPVLGVAGTDGQDAAWGASYLRGARPFAQVMLWEGQHKNDVSSSYQTPLLGSMTVSVVDGAGSTSQQFSRWYGVDDNTLHWQDSAYSGKLIIRSWCTPMSVSAPFCENDLSFATSPGVITKDLELALSCNIQGTGVQFIIPYVNPNTTSPTVTLSDEYGGPNNQAMTAYASLAAYQAASAAGYYFDAGNSKLYARLVLPASAHYWATTAYPSGTYTGRAVFLRVR